WCPNADVLPSGKLFEKLGRLLERLGLTMLFVVVSNEFEYEAECREHTPLLLGMHELRLHAVEFHLLVGQTAVIDQQLLLLGQRASASEMLFKLFIGRFVFGSQGVVSCV